MNRNLKVCKSRDCCIAVVFPGEVKMRYYCLHDSESNITGGTYSFSERFIKYNIPKDCPYFLEQIVLNSYL